MTDLSQRRFESAARRRYCENGYVSRSGIKGCEPVSPRNERDRLKALERENKQLRWANEILKTASVFAQEEFGPQAQEMIAYIDQHRE